MPIVDSMFSSSWEYQHRRSQPLGVTIISIDQARKKSRLLGFPVEV
jgi:hypothetical protein